MCACGCACGGGTRRFKAGRFVTTAVAAVGVFSALIVRLAAEIWVALASSARAAVPGAQPSVMGLATPLGACELSPGLPSGPAGTRAALSAAPINGCQGWIYMTVLA